MMFPNQVQEMSTEIVIFLRQTNYSLQPFFMVNTVLLGLVSLANLSFLGYKMLVLCFCVRSPKCVTAFTTVEVTNLIQTEALVSAPINTSVNTSANASTDS